MMSGMALLMSVRFRGSREDEPILDGRNILRPETIESLFLAYRLTGEQKYRDQGWRMFKAFEKYCRLPGGGYAGIADVENGMHVERLDKMETFWLSETLSESTTRCCACAPVC